MDATRRSVSTLIASGVVLALLGGCGGGDNDPEPGGGDPPGGGGVTFTPTTGPVTTAWHGGALNPAGMVFLPDRRFVVTMREGYAARYRTDGTNYLYLDMQQIQDMLVGTEELGIQDVVSDPDFLSNNRLYFSYVERLPNELEAGIAVARVEVAEDGSLSDVQVIYRQPKSPNASTRFGGRMAFDREDYLFLTLGDLAAPIQPDLVQDVSTGYGKVVRITTDGAPAPGNPVVAGGLSGLWSWGHRSPEGAVIHPDTGDLWTVEAGPQGGDEVNITLPGRNYGWPVISHGQIPGLSSPWAGGTAQAGMEQPVAVWDTRDGSLWTGGIKSSIRPSGMAFFTGDQPAHWKGSLFVSSRVGGVWRIQLDGTREVGRERLLTDLNLPVLDLRMGPDGHLFILVGDGTIRRVSVG
jgi:glucose/arabinose dehydrogenase